MVETKDVFQGAYLSFDSTKDNDIVTIIGEGTVSERKNKFTGSMEPRLDLPVQINEKDYIWSPFNKDGTMLQEKWGTDSKAWVGKKLQILHIDKKMVVRIMEQ